MTANPVRDFAGTPQGEWQIVNGDFAVVAGQAAVPQGIRCRVSLILGEASVLDQTKGVDYLGAIIVKNPDPLVVKGVLQEAISETPDVTNVYGAQLIGPTAQRSASIAWQVDTVYSQNPFSDQVTVP